MKIYDISQEVFSCRVFPGDPAPERKAVMRMENGSLYNLTCFSMCAHNGTHIDAPYHFISNGKTAEQVALEKAVGYACVLEHEGEVSAEVARLMLATAEKSGTDAARRLLIKGNAVVTLEAAEVFAASGVWLIGNESQTVGPETSPMAVHQVLLSHEVVLLEGIRLGKVPCGVYLLSAAPLALGASDGAPCRALLMQME